MPNLYAGTYLLADYVNEFASISAIIQLAQLKLGRDMHADFTLEQLRSALAQSPIKTVKQHFSKPSKEWDEMRKYPEAVARLNKLATLANACTDITTLKQIRNEVSRLLYGMDIRLNYPQPEFSPDLLNV